MRENSNGFGRVVFMEWLIPIVDYLFSVRKNEAVFEMLIPLVTALSST